MSNNSAVRASGSAVRVVPAQSIAARSVQLSAPMSQPVGPRGGLPVEEEAGVNGAGIGEGANAPPAQSIAPGFFGSFFQGFAQMFTTCKMEVRCHRPIVLQCWCFATGLAPLTAVHSRCAQCSQTNCATTTMETTMEPCKPEPSALKHADVGPPCRVWVPLRASRTQTPRTPFVVSRLGGRGLGRGVGSSLHLCFWCCILYTCRPSLVCRSIRAGCPDCWARLGTKAPSCGSCPSTGARSFALGLPPRLFCIHCC